MLKRRLVARWALDTGATDEEGVDRHGGAVQVDPGFSQLTLHVLSTLEPEI